MFYNSLFQSVFNFWIKLSKKNCSKITEEGQWFCCEKWLKKYKRVRDTSLWKFTGCACGIKVNFSPCVMTWAVLANFVPNSVQTWLYRKNSYTEFFARAQFIKDFLSRIRYNFSKPGSVSDSKKLRIPLIFGITFLFIL